MTNSPYKAYRANKANKAYWAYCLIALLLLPFGASAQINIGGSVFGGARQANVDGHTFIHIGAEKHDVVINYVFGGNDISGTIGSSTVPSEIKKASENGVDGSWNAFIRLSAKVKADGTEDTQNAKKVYIGQLFGGGYGDYEYKNETTGEGNQKIYDVDIPYTVWDPNISDYGPGVHELKGIAKPELGKTYLEICGGSIDYAYGGGNNVTVTEEAVIYVDNPSSVVTSITDKIFKDPDDQTKPLELLTNERFEAMGINTTYSYPSSDAFQIGRLFGGNNKAPMAIRPMWYLQQGKIRNLYSGGNEGAMTSPVGLFLEVNPKVPDGLTFEQAKAIKDKLVIDNVYGGCRKADVHPLSATGQEVGSEDIDLIVPGYIFPKGLSARVSVLGGDVNNVYGGNDITGRVYGGNAVGVHCSIRGSIYGGGNGSYPYTDNDILKNSLTYGDFYYNPDEVIAKEIERNSSYTPDPNYKSVEALNLFRPNAEQVSVRIKGTDALHPTIIGGSVYVGGNSATLNTKRNEEQLMLQLKIGSYVIAENVFLGNNGENMIKYNEKVTDNNNQTVEQEGVLRTIAKYVKPDGTISDTQGTEYTKFNSMDLTDPKTFAKYMEGCAMSLRPEVTFDETPRDPDDYVEYSSYFGSFFCGGNVGSITRSGKMTIDFKHSIIVYDKVVGGCNNAYVLPQTGFNAEYRGGIIGSEAERPADLASNPRFIDGDGNIKTRLELNFEGLKIQPLRPLISGVDDNASLSTNTRYLPLAWNTIKLGVRDAYGDPVPVAWNDNTWAPAADGHTALYNSTVNRRFTGGNIYGGCCESGVVNGNVVINIKASIVDRTGEHGVFDILPTDDDTGEDKLYNNDYDFDGHQAVSGVILGQQGMDVLGTALNVFGGGKGAETEIWGSTTINLTRGYVFQIFGGSEQGAIGKREVTTTNGVTTDAQDAFGRYKYTYNAKYSTYVNLVGSANHPGVPKSEDMSDDIAEAEFLYGGGFIGAVAGNTHINLDNGRIFNSFAGSCNANIQGHTETIIGANGFPYVRDYVYGGNDLGGKILGLSSEGANGVDCNFTSRVRTQDRDGYDAIGKVYNTDMLKASAYTEYIQGRIEKIFGGCYGVYDYTDQLYGEYFYATGGTGTTTGDNGNLGKARPGFSKPFLDNAFINFRPSENNNPLNSVGQIYGAGQGYFTEREENLMQNSSYILIDVPQSMQTFQTTEVFGAGECGGVGMGVDPAVAGAPATAHKASAIIDLARGYLNAVYGGSYQEGITRRTVVNVPTGSTFRGNSIFGGAYGRIDVETRVKQDGEGHDVLDEDGNPVLEIISETPRIDVACDVYEAIVNYNSDDATIDYAIYGGNNACRRTLYGQVNIYKPVKGGTHWTGLVNVYGAGYGVNTWSQYTEVNLFDGAKVQEVYGGGENGQVLNVESVNQWKLNKDNDTNDQYKLFTGLEGYTDYGFGDAEHPTPANSNRLYEIDNTRPQYYNTNVHINKGATVTRYCYGGGLGHSNIAHSGNVYGTTYIDLLGGTVDYDLYAAGTSGSVKDSLAVKTFLASSTAYIEGGKVRNVYGGGWAGTVGHHDGSITASYANDIPGETNVIIGIYEDDLATTDGTADFYYYHGIPAIARNAYGGGEGGAVWGTAHLTMLNGYIGYQYDATKSDVETTDFDERYVEKIEDDTYRDEDGHFQSNKRLNDAGCIFGGGYIDNSSVDITDVKMYGGHVRNAMFGGGEIAAIGRGVITVDQNDITKRTLSGIYKAGRTSVEMYDGYVHRNVFGGGRGYNNLGEGGNLYSDGYVFGHTEVHIHGGEIGTPEELANENGNVFGGGDIGYVYSANEEDGNFYVGIKDGQRYDDLYEGYYYKLKLNEGQAYNGEDATHVTSKGQWVMDGTEYILTEDCKVLVEPHCKVLTACTINGHNYAVGDYVSTEDLNALGNKNASAATWACLDLKGIIIHNAVFAGGNTTKGSVNAQAFANTTSVYGNATASIHDVYNRDLITLGSGRIGGLYGDGNLTLVDGYRGLNITNYGTDYYTISSNMEISIEQYNNLVPREQAYYQLTYKCLQQCTDDEGTTYFPQDNDHSKASTLTSDEIFTLFARQETMFVTGNDGVVPNPVYWQENGVCTIYAGRPMNTIQRADFCGVFGSRMVMQGAQDRVPEIVDYKRYTINRVREVSLNKKKYTVGGVESTTDYHGNYFGIYSLVNYLGALTSDVDFHTGVRVTDNSDKSTYEKTVTIDGHDYAYGTATFEQWKQANRANRTRNNGNSYNKVALASGVYLELTSERSTGDDLYEKDWGPITGVIELDLINVQTGIGGGFVYAKNIHGVRTPSGKTHVTLTALNRGAVTSDDFEYAAAVNDNEWESSGNFVHGEQIIIDDCYNISSRYTGAVNPDGSGAVPAHYWYIQGSVYVYDQFISVYTGVPNAYSETVDLPLTITAASHGTMKLLDVQPNLYAYYNSNGTNRLNEGQRLNINGVNYQLNDSISYWDWYKLTKTEQKLFVKETYVTTMNCVIGQSLEDQNAITLSSGYVMLPGDKDDPTSESDTYYYYWNLAPTGKLNENDTEEVKYVLDSEGKRVAFDKVFHSTNNMSHDTGYILTYKVNNPTDWDTWYTKRISNWNDKNQTGGNDYENGPTYRLKNDTPELLGQREYNISNLIAEDVYTTYKAIEDDPIKTKAIPATGQAVFEPAYIVTEQIDIPGSTSHYYPGAALSKTEARQSYCTGKVAEAYICTKTIQLSTTEYIYVNSKMTLTEKNNYISSVNSSISTIAGKVISDMSELTDEEVAALSYDQKKELRTLLQTKKDIQNLITKAYYCTTAGLYGGDYYESGRNYRGLAAWSSMAPADREKFEFNYDAFDLLIDPYYSLNPNDPTTVLHPERMKYQYDSPAGDLAGAQENPAGYSLERPVNYTATYNGNETGTYNGVTLANGQEYSRTEYESLPNEQRHYSSINVTNTDATYYVVKLPITIGNKPYAVGSTITPEEFNKLGQEDKETRISQLKFTTTGTYYYCRESYTIGEKGSGVAVNSATGVTGATGATDESYAVNSVVPVGVVIDNTGTGGYSGLTNKKLNFTIHGIAPTETSTLYVSRDSDIDDLSRGKIITVIYEYNYEESDETGQHITPITERHIVNIHIYFKSGSPIVEDIEEPPMILPGDLLGLREPNVIPGATEVTGGGWKLFEKESDAESHTNGIDYTPNVDQLYWYQDGYWLEYYAKSYIGGETYSNKVKIKVANYHDLTDVMEDKEHHYFVDIPDLDRLGRVPKIYITDDTNGVQQLKNMFDLSLLDRNSTGVTDGVVTASGPLNGHSLLESQVNSCQNLEFFMHTNVNMPSGSTWEPIANNTGECFSATLHGDGYYISGLTRSLFGHLCGNVYNLGVTGPFTSAGIADYGTGFIENCWIRTTATSGFDGNVKAVFGYPGNPDDPEHPEENDGLVHVVNCYYNEAPLVSTNPETTLSPYYKAGDGTTPMPFRAFHNGTVTYDLNGFYLYKRYCDKEVNSGTEYQYYTIDPTTGSLSEPNTKYYASNLTYCSSGYNGEKYVEERFADGDFRYANGTIPNGVDERLHVNNDKSEFYPIWPDDYLFFGQMLTYGWNPARPHEEVPSPIVKNSGRLPDASTDISNRVYRAPAYYRNATMDVAHFNPDVNLVAYSKPANAADTNLHPAYPNMTAIDFAGHNDAAYKLGLQNGWFYQPLLDDDGLQSIVNRDETVNLLVYSPSSDANQQTYTVLNSYFTEPAYITYYGGDGGYRCVAVAPTQTIHGHLVQSTLTTDRDHLLVDKQDFFCPIAYTMGSGKHIWYQRVPNTYVDLTKGWEGISLPFEAELVSTNDKGEITHFYSGSYELYKNGNVGYKPEPGSETGKKVGHEYWLHECDDITVDGTSGNEVIAEASLQHPFAITGQSKTVYNTFLWDHYYNNVTPGHNHLDANQDTYQTFYSTSRTYDGYPLFANGTPYLIGFPGETYYEFDLSGGFEAKTTALAPETPGVIGEQTISFVSVGGYHVANSDSEMDGVSHNGYTFRPSYLNEELNAGTGAYSLNAAGDKYVKVPATGDAVTVTAFRPFFILTSQQNQGSSPAPAAAYITFSNEASQIHGPEVVPDIDENLTENLKVYPKRNKITVESELREETGVQIYSAGGAIIDSYNIKPGEIVETPIYSAGVYIVRTTNGRYTKKVSIK